MKKLFSVLLCILISITCLSSSACVYHEHTFDNHNFCRECGFDNAAYMLFDANIYAAPRDYYSTDEDYAFNLVGNGKTSYEFKFESETGNVTFTYLHVFKEGEFQQFIPDTRQDEISSWVYAFTFEEGAKYRIEFRPSSEGRATFKITF